MKFSAIYLSVLCIFLTGSSVFCQETENSELGTITVTAQKQEENIQKVPLSISILDEYTIEDSNIRTLSDAALLVPNFQQFSVGGAGMYNPCLRGIFADVHTASSPAATYIDGIPYLGSMGNNLILEDIERIEVLKGPQGTLYGKNAYAGVINIISRKPNNEFKGKLKVELGESNKREYAASIGTPIVKDKFYIRLSAKHYEKDGFIENKYLNKKDDNAKDDSVRLSLRYEPISNLSVSLISNYMKKDDGAIRVAMLSAPNPKITNANFEGYTRSKSLSGALKIAYKWDKMALTSVSTYKKYNDIRGTDYDYSPLNFWHSTVDSEFTDYSQELRLNGQTNGLNWITGIYLDKNDKKPFYAKNSVPETKNETNNKGLGVFANLEYALSENLILLSGIRYDKDKITVKDYLQNYANDKSYDEISPKIGLKYIYNNSSFYISAAKGYKRGGYYFLAPIDKKSYDPETLWNYEIGLKSLLLNNTLVFNASAFYMNIKDMQVTSNISPAVAYVSNAAKATSKGFEMETSYRIFKPLTVFANIGVAQTKFDSFSDAPGDYAGNNNPFAPTYNYAAGFAYRDALGIFARFDLSGQDSFYTDKANTFKNDAYAIMNAKIGYEAKYYEIYLYGKNLADQKYDTKGYFNSFTILSPPRELGVQLALRF